MLALLSSMKEEAVMGVRALDIQEGFATSVRVATLKTQLNLTNMLLSLPEVIKEVEDRNERIAAKMVQMKDSQERGEI